MHNSSPEPYSLFARYYDLAWAEYAQYCRDLISAAEESALRPFRRICDAACGTGLLLSLLADSGRNLMGFDISPAMLARARERLKDIPLRQADLQDPFPFHGPLDLVTCLHDSLNYLTEPDQLLEFFRRVRRVLAPDGVLICDLNAPELYTAGAAQSTAGAADDYLLDGANIRQSMEYRRNEQIGITRLQFPGGTEVHRQRAYTREEGLQLLHTAGLHLSDVIEVEQEDAAAGAIPSGKVVYVAVK